MIITGNQEVAKTICARLREVNVSLEKVASTPVNGLADTLKGVEFRVDDLKAARQIFTAATDSMGRPAFYDHGKYVSEGILRELLRNAPALLDMSFAASDGYGYREIRDFPMLPSLSSFRPPQKNPSFSSRFGFEDEQSLTFEVSSLHVALSLGTCNIHIDNMGFVVRGPYGVFLNPNFPQHLFNELGLQTMAAPYLGVFLGRMAKFTQLVRSDQSKAIGNWISKNVNLELPSHKNGYRPGIGVSVNPTPRLTISAKFTAKCGYCREKEEDFGIPIPDGWSIGGGITYRFGRGK